MRNKGEFSMSVSKAFALFMQEAPGHAEAWMQAVKALDAASALDKKTEELAYLAVLAATGNISGVPFHVVSAKSHGASREEVLSAVLVGLPAAGAVVIGAIPAALEAYDSGNL
jgi:alkylhydroperoxidase/carboxymuconolactone decarboxylase family protein YurZ